MKPGSDKGKRTRIVGRDGDPCPRCQQPTEIREHTTITEKELSRPFYYRRWFNCTNPRCRTTLVMPERFKVYREAEPEPKTETQEWLERWWDGLTPDERGGERLPWED
jgi:hypothetical protein